jgi:tRNA nucleotidyltransferase/poly(A) polymerase
MNKFEKTLEFIKQTITQESPFWMHIWLVGGCVRDELLGERYSDLDLLIDLPQGQKQFVEYMCKTYPDVCRGPFYYQRYGTTAMDVIIDDALTLVECVEPHVENYADDGVTLLETRFCSLEEDAVRRDYTCNALYKNLHSGQVADPTGKGLDDLNAGLLRTPRDPEIIYRQDPVRMLRGIRFKHQKGFRLDEAAWDAILHYHEEIAKSAPKRLRDELNKLLKTASFGEAVNDLLICGLLPYVFPGLNEYFEDNTHMDCCEEEGTTLWQHTRMALYTLLKEHPHADTVSKLAVLMTDIADKAGISHTQELLHGALIGKEKASSVLYTIQCYQRFRSFYGENQTYLGKNRTLPHFIKGLNSNKTEFRRIVRAMNSGLRPELRLPYNIFYDNAKLPESRNDSSTRRKKMPALHEAVHEPLPLSEAQKLRNHKRNLKRKEQRRRAKAKRRAANQNKEPQD